MMEKTFQERLALIHLKIFGEDPTDVAERCARFLEETLETVQAFGMPEDDALDLVAYTFGRPKGEPKKEIGAAAVTLTSLAIVAGMDINECAEADLELLGKDETIERIKTKRSTRHGRGALPGVDPADYAPSPTEHVVGIELAARFVEKRRDDYVQEHGFYDGETGVTEFPGNGDEYVGELEEVIEGIRALASEVTP